MHFCIHLGFLLERNFFFVPVFVYSAWLTITSTYTMRYVFMLLSINIRYRSSVHIACVLMKSSLRNVCSERDLFQGSQTNPFQKHLISFSLGLPWTLCAYFVCVLSILYRVSMLILNHRNFSSSTITPSHMLISQNVLHASESKHHARVLRTWLQFVTEFQLGCFLWKAQVINLNCTKCLFLFNPFLINFLVVILGCKVVT